MSRPLGFALLAAVIVVVAGLITLLEAAGKEPSLSEGGAANPLDLEPTAGGHEFPGVTAWLNGDPVASLGELEGKVVLIDFWTYTCVNCIRTIPFLRAWNDEYADKGLVIIGIHSPEFTFEKSLGNVRTAVADLGIPWLVANDPERTSWDAFRARAWPTKILFGFDGRERKRVVGEGQYREMEQVIRLSLVESGVEIPETPFTTDNPDLEIYESLTREVLAGWRWEFLTSRRYLGNPEGSEFDAPYAFTDPGPPRPDGVYYLDGTWLREREAAVHDRTTGSYDDYISISYAGRTANAVIEPRGLGDPLRVLVTRDGQPLADSIRGPDVISEGGQTYLIVDEPRMYRIVAADTIGRHELRLSPLSDRFAFHTFTFGP